MDKTIQLLKQNWKNFSHLFDKKNNIGRPRKYKSFDIVVLFIKFTKLGFSWEQLSNDCKIPKSTLFYRFKLISKSNAILKMIDFFLSKLLENQNNLSLQVDGTHVNAKQGGQGVDFGNKGKGTTIQVLTLNNLVPIAAKAYPASKHEVTTIIDTLKNRYIKNKKISSITGDKAYDSDKHDKIIFKQFQVKLIAPHKRNRINPTQNQEELIKMYKKHYTVESFNAWMKNFSRIQIRKDRTLSHFQTWIDLFCLFVCCFKLASIS